MRCDFCQKRNVDCNPVYAFGDTFMICEDCYEREADKGTVTRVEQ